MRTIIDEEWKKKISRSATIQQLKMITCDVFQNKDDHATALFGMRVVYDFIENLINN
jgi:hypothetical protein